MLNHELLEIAIRSIFAQHPGVECFTVPAGDQGGLLARLPMPAPGLMDILLFDALPGDETNPNWVFHLKRNRTSLGVIFLLPAAATEAMVTQALRSGADGYLFHSARPEQVVLAVETVAAGRAFIQPDITPLVLDELRRPRFTVHASDVQTDLSERERMLLQLSADGLSNSQISEVFHVHEKTVRNMWSGLFHKLGMSDRTQAVLWAVRNGHAELR